MSTYTFPDIAPTNVSISLVSNTGILVSQLSGAVQSRDRSGERWLVRATYANLTNAQAAELSAFLTRLNGQQHRFTWYDRSHSQRGAFGGTPLVFGGSQTGTTLDIDGASISVTNWIRAGDFFSVNSRLKMAVLDASSDGSGELTLTFSPRLMTAPSNNDPITIDNPVGTFLLARNEASWSVVPGPFTTISIEFIEDIAA